MKILPNKLGQLRKVQCFIALVGFVWLLFIPASLTHMIFFLPIIGAIPLLLLLVHPVGSCRFGHESKRIKQPFVRIWLLQLAVIPTLFMLKDSLFGDFSSPHPLSSSVNFPPTYSQFILWIPCIMCLTALAYRHWLDEKQTGIPEIASLKLNDQTSPAYLLVGSISTSGLAFVLTILTLSLSVKAISLFHQPSPILISPIVGLIVAIVVICIIFLPGLKRLIYYKQPNMPLFSFSMLAFSLTVFSLIILTSKFVGGVNTKPLFSGSLTAPFSPTLLICLWLTLASTPMSYYLVRLVGGQRLRTVALMLLFIPLACTLYDTLSPLTELPTIANLMHQNQTRYIKLVQILSAIYCLYSFSKNSLVFSCQYQTIYPLHSQKKRTITRYQLSLLSLICALIAIICFRLENLIIVIFFCLYWPHSCLNSWTAFASYLSLVKNK